MKRLTIILLATSLLLSINCYSQQNKGKAVITKTQETNTKSKNQEVKPDQGDKIIKGKKGPDGQVVYEGIKGGHYYINKNGNKTYLKEDDKVVANKKGPDGQKIYVGPQGGEYYINKSGNKVYIKNDKK